jgi:hypothetical protein
VYSPEHYRKERDRLRAEIESSRTPEERSRSEELRTRRAAYEVLSGAIKKEINELQVFQAFAKVAPIQIDIGSERNAASPEPDVRCAIGGAPYYFELGEITDQAVARSLAMAFERDELTGGAFSQDRPFATILANKATKTYETSGVSVDLLLYYRKQYPPGPQYFSEMVDSCRHSLSAALIGGGGPFDRIWVFNFWEDRVLLTI